MKSINKNIYATLCFLFYGLLLHAQSAGKVELKLHNNEDVQEIVSLGSDGFIIRTAERYFELEKKIHVYAYDASMHLKWHTSLLHNSNTSYSNFMVASEIAPYVYWFQQISYTATEQEYLVTRIDSTGAKTEIKCAFAPDLRADSSIAAFSDQKNMKKGAPQGHNKRVYWAISTTFPGI